MVSQDRWVPTDIRLSVKADMIWLRFDVSVDAMMITLLDSGNRELVYISCGVLINFMLDEDKRAVLKKEGGVTK